MKMQTQLTKVDQFKQVLNGNQIRAQLKNSLKNNAGAFMSSMLDLYSSDTTLQKCDPKEVAMECLKAASLNLPIVKSLGFAYVVPYKNKPTFTIGYKGLIQLAQRTGQYKYVNADVVYEGELVQKDKLSGMIDISGEKISDKVIGYFAYFKLLNGFEKMLYMSKEEVIAWKDRYSPSAKSSYSPWNTDFDKMAMKTCLRRLLSTYGVMSAEMQKAIVEDKEPVSERVEKEIKQNANTIVIDSNTGEIKDETPKEQPQTPKADF
jgi:recombination protein RecT